MNPSVLIDNGKVIVNVRNVNYTLYHAEAAKPSTINGGHSFI
jgi:hypothetical protein